MKKLFIAATHFSPTTTIRAGHCAGPREGHRPDGTGDSVPLSVIRTPYVEKIGTKVNPLSRWLLQNRWTEPWMRLWYAIASGRRFKQITLKGGSSKDYWQAGKSVRGIHAVEHVGDIIKRTMQQRFLNNAFSC